MLRKESNMVKTLKGAIAKARKMALADVYGLSEDCFTAVTYRKTLPKAWQEKVEEAIIDIYHHT